MYKKFLLTLMISFIAAGYGQAQDATSSPACEKFNAMKKEAAKSGITKDILLGIAGMSERLMDCVEACNCGQADCMNAGMAENARLKDLPENKGKNEDDYYVPYQQACSDKSTQCAEACKAKFPGELEGDAPQVPDEF